MTEILKPLKQQQEIKKAQDDLDTNISEVVSHFKENFYFMIFHSKDSVEFCFNIPEQHGNKNFFEINVRFDFVLEEQDYSSVLEFDMQTIKINNYTITDEIALLMMHGKEIDKSLLNENQKQYSSNVIKYHSLPITHITVIDYFEQINKDIILPYLKTLSFNVDGQTLTAPKNLLKEIIADHKEYFGNFIASIYTGQTVDTDISNNELKEILDIHNHYKILNQVNKLETTLPQKKYGKKLKL